jgi:transcriptional regulator with XRE-family HTH domain
VKNTLGGSPVARRQLGNELRRLRNEAGKTHADVQEALIASRTKMWRIEHGETNTRPADVLALARLPPASTSSPLPVRSAWS